MTLLDEPARVLVVDDDRPTRTLLRRTLERDGHVIEEAEDGETAIAIVERDPPDVMLLDGCMPGLDGFAVCRRLTDNSGAPSMPIVMVTSLDDDESIAQAFDAGATDYVSKPINCSLLRHRLRRTIIGLRRQRRVDHLAHYDLLTGLPNRALFLDRSQQALATAERRNEGLAVLYFDLDGFKQVNDTMGHEAGDRLLKEVGDRLASLVRSCDTVARLGGDEFILLVVDTGTEQGVMTVAQRVLDTVSTPVTLADTAVSVTSSIGIAMYPVDGTSLQVLVARADAAMYHAKKGGGGTYRFAARAGRPSPTVPVSREGGRP